MHTCVTASTFPGQVHCGAIVYGSVKCDPELGTSEVAPSPFPRGGHIHTHVGCLPRALPCTSLSLRNCKLSTTVGDTRPGLPPCRYQLVPEPDWGGGRGAEGTHDRETPGGSMLSISGFHLSHGLSGGSLGEPRWANRIYRECTILVLHVMPKP